MHKSSIKHIDDFVNFFTNRFNVGPVCCIMAFRGESGRPVLCRKIEEEQVNRRLRPDGQIIEC